MVNNIKEYREKQGYSQKELAKLLKISPSYLSGIERGERDLSIKLAYRIAVTLDCSLDDLFFNR